MPNGRAGKAGARQRVRRLPRVCLRSTASQAMPTSSPRILVLNGGSSSIRFAVLRADAALARAAAAARWSASATTTRTWRSDAPAAPARRAEHRIRRATTRGARRGAGAMVAATRRGGTRWPRSATASCTGCRTSIPSASRRRCWPTCAASSRSIPTTCRWRSRWSRRPQARACPACRRSPASTPRFHRDLPRVARAAADPAPLRGAGRAPLRLPRPVVHVPDARSSTRAAGAARRAAA